MRALPAEDQEPLIFRGRPLWPAASDREPGVTVWAVTSEVRFGGLLLRPMSVRAWRVPPDFAGDLAHRAQAYADPSAGDRRGVLIWEVGAIGFISAEAMAAFEAALEWLRSPAGLSAS